MSTSAASTRHSDSSTKTATSMPNRSSRPKSILLWYTTIPFGYITANIIFEYLARLKDDVHHDKLMEWYDEVGFEYDKETGEKDVQYLKPFLVKLQEVILNLGKYRQNEHKAEMKAALLDTLSSDLDCS